MLQIIDLENNQLFTQVSAEESAIVSGGAGTGTGIGALGMLGYGALIALSTGIIGHDLAHALVGFGVFNTLAR